MDTALADKNLFMMCERLEPGALTELSTTYHVRTCRKDELDIWKRIHFDSPESADESYAFMTRYFNEVYAHDAATFFERCLWVSDERGTPIATGFEWKAYGQISTIHWLKVVKTFEGLGIGRALLSIVMRRFGDDEYPVYLHTQPGSFRAIKLYSDFGFALLTDPVVGYRPNELDEGLAFLQAHMPPHDFARLQFKRAPKPFLEAARSSTVHQF